METNDTSLIPSSKSESYSNKHLRDVTGLGEVRVKTRAYILSKLHNHLCMLCWVCQKEFCDRVTRGTHVEKGYSEDVEHIESVL